MTDKTMVVWVSPTNLGQHGGSALTIDDGASHFDGVVFGELSPKKWMPGSDGFSRSQKDQSTWPEETASSDTFVQIAIVYRGTNVSVYRNGSNYASYSIQGVPLSLGKAATVLFGRRHIDAKDSENSFAGRISDARVYDSPLDQQTIAKLKPGSASGAPKPWAWWFFADDGLREKTGRFTEISLIGDARVENGCLVLGGQGSSALMTALGDGPRAIVPKTWSLEGAVPDEVVRSTRLLREKLLADPYRPGYHFCLPEDIGIPGDPNGAIYYQGRYHLMYLYNRSGSGFCWGHISSSDLVHWRHHSDAIGPGNGDEGCFSGGGFVDDDGTAVLSYWMLWGAKGIGLATSRGPDFEVWKKSSANPVIPSTEWGVTETKSETYGSADPSNIWKKNGKYYMLTGNLLVLNKLGRAADSPVSEQGDRLYLFESSDLKKWGYKGVFYSRKPEWTHPSEDNMCPSFLPLPLSPDGGKISNKHLLLFISHNMGCQYYVGDYQGDRFIPNNHGRMTWIDNTYFAPEALIDGKGRQIMWSWLTDNPSSEKERGWSGVYGLPRTLWLGEDGTLRMRPVKEIEMLRGQGSSWSKINLDKPVVLDGFAGDSFEIDAEVTLSEKARFDLLVRASKDKKEFTRLSYDSATNELILDSTMSGSDGRKVVERAPLALKPRESLRLRVFVDKSVIEVYANDRQAICRRVYPTRKDSLGVIASGTGGVVAKSLRAWSMNPSNPY